MKLLRFGECGMEKPGLLDDDGQIRDLSSIISDLNPATLDKLFLLDSLDHSTLPIVDNVRIASCISQPGKFICIGYNSLLHTQQMGAKPLDNNEMMVFLKPSCAVCGPNDPILFTPLTKKLDWEAELGIVIGKKGKYIKKENAKEHILGYTCVNDLSERFWQFEMADKQYTKGKGFDNAAPLGPYLVTRDEIHNSKDLHVQLWVNGELRQDFKTNDYINDDETIVSYLSQFFTLYPGDVISMGSAPGNAKAWGEQYLKIGDMVELSISGLGRQKQSVMKEEIELLG